MSALNLMDEDESSLATNYLPSVEEANAIKSRNMKRGKLIRGINDEIATLRARRRRLIAASTIGKATIAPIRKIPVEVLEEIFFQCIPPFDSKLVETEEYHLYPQDVSKLLGNVCKEWGTIINDSPRLWSSIFISREPSAAEDVCQLLTKSKSHPLDIVIESNELGPDQKMPVSTDVIAMLRRELWRIRTLRAYMDLESELFPPGFSLHAPLMRSFAHSSWKYDPQADMDLSGAYCPQLRSVSLMDSDSIIRVFTANPMQSVRHLLLNVGTNGALYLRFLNSLSHLVSLHWYTSSDEEEPLEAPLTVTLQCLKSLHVDASKSTMQLLPHLHTPSLESLALFCYDGCRFDISPPIDDIIDIICRDGVVKLRRLYITDGEFEPHTTRMLRKLDHLDTLVINRSFFAVHLVDALKVHGYVSLCPKLTTLVLENIRVPLASIDDFVHHRTLADSEEPAPGFVTCLKLHGELFSDHMQDFQHLLQTHSATIHITSKDDPDPALEYFPPTMWWE